MVVTGHIAYLNLNLYPSLFAYYHAPSVLPNDDHKAFFALRRGQKLDLAAIRVSLADFTRIALGTVGPILTTSSGRNGSSAPTRTTQAPAAAQLCCPPASVWLELGFGPIYHICRTREQ